MQTCIQILSDRIDELQSEYELAAQCKDYYQAVQFYGALIQLWRLKHDIELITPNKET